MEKINKILIVLGLAGSLFASSSVWAADGSANSDAVNTAQQEVRDVKVTVTDASGPVLGASVSVKGTTVGDATGVDGTVTLKNVASDAVLLVSYIGYQTQEVAVGNRSAITVQLVEDTNVMDEVVVVGYGVQKKATLTGAVSSIGSKEITSTKTENLVNNIQGKIPGLLIRQQSGEPGEFNNMVSIRGFGEPLVVIDGIVRDGTSDLAQLNSNDIENISVLKDGAAAIYGMGASNGVIIVTTKKGVEGKAQISYTGSVSFKTPTAIEPTVDAVTYYKLANEMNRNDGFAENYSQDFIQKYIDGEPGYADHDWYDLFMKDFTTSQSHNITVRGGSEKVKYFTSFAYDDDNGLLKSNIQYYRRFNLRSNVVADLNKNLKLTVGFAGRLDDRRQTREEFIWNYKTLLVNERGKDWHTIANENHFTDLAPESKNVAALIDPDVDGYNKTQNRRYQTTIDLVYTVPGVQGLSIGASGAFDSSNWAKQTLQKSYQLYDYYTDAFSKNFGTDTYQSQMQLQQRLYGRVQINYGNTFGDHTVGATLVAEYNRSRGDYLTGSRNYEVYTNDILDQGAASTATNGGNRNVQVTAAYLGRVNYDYKGKYIVEALARYDGSYRYAPGRQWAFFPYASIGWRISEEPFIKDNAPAITNLKVRASRGETGRNVGEAFAYVAGYGNNGSYTFDGQNVITGNNSTTIVSDRLTWVKSTTTNIGIDLDLWNGKLGGSLEIFERKNTGLLASRQQSIPSDLLGASFSQENLNSNRNRGIEFNIYHRNQVNNDFSYQISANFTYAREMTLHDEGNNNFTSSMDRWHYGTENRLTGRYNAWQSAGNWTWYQGMFEYDGQYQSLGEIAYGPLMNNGVGNSKVLPGATRLKDLNGNGIIDQGDVSYQYWNTGLNPPIQFGLSFAFTWKNLDFNMLLQGASGNSIQWKLDDIWGYGRYPSTYEKYLDRWHTAVEGADPYDPATEWVKGYWPSLRNYDTYNSYTMDCAPTTRQIIPATYVRLKSLEIGYTLPRKLTDKIGLGSVRIYASGYNLFTICDKLLKGADPERIEGSWNAGLTYPLMRVYNIGLNINF